MAAEQHLVSNASDGVPYPTYTFMRHHVGRKSEAPYDIKRQLQFNLPQFLRIFIKEKPQAGIGHLLLWV